MITILPPDSWDPLDEALRGLEAYDWIVFASVNAVESCLKRISQLDFAVDLSSARLAAIGPSTADELRKHKLEPAFSPSQFVAEALVAEFPGYPQLSNTRILWPKTNIGRTYIAENLGFAGAIVDVVPCYKTGGPEDPERLSGQLIELLAAGAIDVVTLASSETTRNLAGLLDSGLARLSRSAGSVGQQMKPLPRSLSELLCHTLIAAIGPETAQAARENLGRVDVEASEYTIQGLVDALCAHLQKRI